MRGDATMREQHFNATIELKKLREYKYICRKRRYQTSRLNKCREELIKLTDEGASFREMALWLRLQKHIRVSHTTVLRYLQSIGAIKTRG
jgi:hypothetical protein